uniref:(northern house mosquito) hypothetical protein n=1 Tax=Culex pipiens TaxID=7175 RepID=A0A8D8NJW2_CULPI
MATEELVVQELAGVERTRAEVVVDDKCLDRVRRARLVRDDLRREHELDRTMLGKVALELERRAVKRNIANENGMVCLQLLQYIRHFLGLFLRVGRGTIFVRLQLTLQGQSTQQQRSVVLLHRDVGGSVLVSLGRSREFGAGDSLLDRVGRFETHDGSIVAVASVHKLNLSKLLEVVVHVLLGNGLLQRRNVHRRLVVGDEGRAQVQSVDALAFDDASVQRSSSLDGLLLSFVEHACVVGRTLVDVVRDGLGDDASFGALLLHFLLILNPLGGNVQQLDAIAIAEEQLGRTPDVKMLVLVPLVHVMRIEARSSQLLQNGCLVGLLVQRDVSQRVEDQHGSHFDASGLNLVPQLILSRVFIVQHGHNHFALNVTDGHVLQVDANTATTQRRVFLLFDGLGSGILLLE